jgi:hypothetical protein
MKFIIDENPIKEERNGYLLVVETMRGDGDDYNTIEVGAFNDNQLGLLEEVIKVCDEMIKAYPHGRCGRDTYDHIEGFKRWFTDNYKGNTEDIQDVAPFEWTYDCDCWEIQDSIEGYELFYLKDGNRYNVKIKK